jgi:hypothetical protein
MKNYLIKTLGIAAISASILSCKSEIASIETVQSSANFAIAARAATSDVEAKGDTVGKGFHHKMTKIDLATLPAAIKSHIAANYAGYTIGMAVKNDVSGDYGVGIKKDSTHKLLSYDKNGVFLKELVRGDKGNKGKFPPNEIKAADLNKAVTAYITANYKTATIHKAFKDVNNNVIVILKDGEIARVLTFDVNNVFVKAAEFKKGDKPNGPQGPKKG